MNLSYVYVLSSRSKTVSTLLGRAFTESDEQKEEFPGRWAIPGYKNHPSARRKILPSHMCVVRTRKGWGDMELLYVTWHRVGHHITQEEERDDDKVVVSISREIAELRCSYPCFLTMVGPFHKNDNYGRRRDPGCECSADYNPGCEHHTPFFKIFRGYSAITPCSPYLDLDFVRPERMFTYTEWINGKGSSAVSSSGQGRWKVRIEHLYVSALMARMDEMKLNYVHDKKTPNLLRRPDFKIGGFANDTVRVFVEIDEYEHRDRKLGDELGRMEQIVGQGYDEPKAGVFIRVNPHHPDASPQKAVDACARILGAITDEELALIQEQTAKVYYLGYSDKKYEEIEREWGDSTPGWRRARWEFPKRDF